MLYPHQVELLLAVEEVDADGTPRLVPSATGQITPAYVQPAASTEDASEGQRLVTRWTAFLPPVVELDGYAYVRWDGTTYELDGDPRRWDTPSGPHHLEASLRRVR